VNCRRTQPLFSFGDSSVAADHPRFVTRPQIFLARLTDRNSYLPLNVSERRFPEKSVPTSCLFSVSSALFSSNSHLLENKGQLPFFKSFRFNLFRIPLHSFPGSPVVSSFYELHTGGVGTPPPKSRVCVARRARVRPASRQRRAVWSSCARGRRLHSPLDASHSPLVRVAAKRVNEPRKPAHEIAAITKALTR
jgi:hypothetical protein